MDVPPLNHDYIQMTKKKTKQFLPHLNQQFKTTNKKSNTTDLASNKDTNREHKEKRMIPSTQISNTESTSRVKKLDVF